MRRGLRHGSGMEVSWDQPDRHGDQQSELCLQIKTLPTEYLPDLRTYLPMTPQRDCMNLRTYRLLYKALPPPSYVGIKLLQRCTWQLHYVTGRNHPRLHYTRRTAVRQDISTFPPKSIFGRRTRIETFSPRETPARGSNKHTSRREPRPWSPESLLVAVALASCVDHTRLSVFLRVSSGSGAPPK